ncbi:hypothetical protein PR048_014911 [Dryococelus australis]|uniref:Uncharacterized protein n=1 Tax=Dryococelus australis TaxID=614101 RepID=A0ABQ9HFQ6_9NEOP|nr:hypothetical protein PR048_014911 [Dryococelus australis]
MCGLKDKICTETPKTNRESMEFNDAWETYQNSHKVLSAVIKEVSWLKIQAAGEEEAALAIQAGEVYDDGIPVIAVLINGACSRKSYITNYIVLSGVYYFVSLVYMHLSLVLKSRRFYLQVQETLTVAVVIEHHLNANQQIPCVTRSGTNSLQPWKPT